MIEDLAVWLMCNPMAPPIGLCVVNTFLIVPGVFGLFAVLVLYLVMIPIIVWKMLKRLYQIVGGKTYDKG